MEVPMQNEGRLYSQVAAEAGVTTEKAMVACYLSNLSNEGKSLDEAATLLRKQRCEVRDVARDWGITFRDYSTVPRPLAIVWVKEKRGRWILAVDGAEIAEAVSDGHGGYNGRELVAGNPSRARIASMGSKAEIAIRRLSVDLERLSVEIFGVDDIEIRMTDETVGGGYLVMAPKPADNAAQLRQALAA
jgi:hypothetical protein